MKRTVIYTLTDNASDYATTIDINEKLIKNSISGSKCLIVCGLNFNFHHRLTIKADELFVYCEKGVNEILLA